MCWVGHCCTVGQGKGIVLCKNKETCLHESTGRTVALLTSYGAGQHYPYFLVQRFCCTSWTLLVSVTYIHTHARLSYDSSWFVYQVYACHSYKCNYWCFQSVMAAVGFHYSDALVLHWQLLILVIVGTVGTFCFCLVEWESTRAHREGYRSIWHEEVLWAMSWENLFMLYKKNKGVDQPVHPRSLISTFVVCCLCSIIPLLAIAEISRL